MNQRVFVNCIKFLTYSHALKASALGNLNISRLHHDGLALHFLIHWMINISHGLEVNHPLLSQCQELEVLTLFLNGKYKKGLICRARLVSGWVIR